MRKCNPTAVTPLPVVKESGRMKPERQVVENKAIKTMHMPLPPYCKMCRRIERGRVTFPEPTNLEENQILSAASPEEDIIPGSPTISGKQNPFTNKSLRKQFKKHCNENHIDLALKAVSAQQSGNTCGQISTPQQNNVAVLVECNSNQQRIGSNKTERKSKNSMGQVYPTIQEASTSHDLDNNAVRKCPTSHDLDNNAVRKCPTSHDLDNSAVRKCPTSHDLDSNAVRKCPMCGLQFIHSMSSGDRDGHIAACLSETGDDIMW